MSIKVQIAKELYQAIKHVSADGELLSIVGSYGDTLEDDDVLLLLRDWNKKRGSEPAPVPRPH